MLRLWSRACGAYSVKSRGMPDFVASASTEIIRSRQNARLKDLRQRLLHPAIGEDGLVAIEGDHLLQEAERSGLPFDTVFLREDRAAERERAFASNVQVLTVAADAFDHVCATDAPQGIAALVKAPEWTLESMLAVDEPRLVILAGLQASARGIRKRCAPPLDRVFGSRSFLWGMLRGCGFWRKNEFLSTPARQTPEPPSSRPTCEGRLRLSLAMKAQGLRMRFWPSATAAFTSPVRETWSL
jgi:hypothetical protein